MKNLIDTFSFHLVPVKMSQKKTEGQTPNVSNPSSNKIDDQDINHTESFTYLGGVIGKRRWSKRQHISRTD